MEHYLLEEETYQIIGACMEVHNELGIGFSEIVYKDALELEFTKLGIPYERERKYQVSYKEQLLPHYFFADFVIFDSIILELKTVSEIVNVHYEQAINYLAVSGLRVGLVINFRTAKLQYKRIILSNGRIKYV
jgi:GxxExxY protein